MRNISFASIRVESKTRKKKCNRETKLMRLQNKFTERAKEKYAYTQFYEVKMSEHLFILNRALA